MKRKNWFLLLGLVLCLACCEEPIQELTPEVSPGQARSAKDSISFTVTLEQSATKTILSDNEVLWLEGDKIKVFNDANRSGVEFTLDGFGGEATGSFSGPAMEGTGPFYAVYPSTAATALNTDGTLSLTVPDTQVYTTEWDTFGVDANISAGYADTETLSGFSFKNLFGVLKLSVSENAANINSIVLYSKNESDVLHGSFSLAFQEDSPGSFLPVATPAEGQEDESHQKLTLACGAGFSSAREFFLVVPSGTLDAGMTIELYDSDGKVQVKNAGAYTPTAEAPSFINRSHLRPMPSFPYSPQYQAAFLLSDVKGGAFTGVSATGTFAEACAYSADSGQYAFVTTAGDNGSRYVRIQDWTDGFALGLTTPYQLDPGSNVSVTVQPLGAAGVSATTDAAMKVLKRTVERVWLFDSATGNGYIMMLVED